METYVLRLWLPDRPGVLGAVAGRIGAVKGDVIGIDILERGNGQAVDELVVALPDEKLVGLLLHEVGEVDGVHVEDLQPVGDAVHDPRLDALETAAILLGCSDPDELLDSLCEHGGRTLGATWIAVVDAELGELRAATGPSPSPDWLTAFVAGSSLAPTAGPGGEETGPEDVAWAPLPAANLAVVVGRARVPFRARERRQVAAVARIVDSRYRELSRARCRSDHPSRG